MRNVTKLTRRIFLSHVTVAGAGAAFCALPAFAVAGSTRDPLKTKTAPTPRTPVVSFHVDRSYLDMSGMSKPYTPPIGARSGQPAADLSDVEFLSRHVYF